MSAITLSMFLGLYVAMAPLPHNPKEQSPILEYQPSEQQKNIVNRDTVIAQSQSMCNYLRQAFKASGIRITDEKTIVALVSGKMITVRDPGGLYTRLSGYQNPSYVDANQNLPNGAFWVNLNEQQSFVQPNTQNISLKSNEKFVALGGYFPIYLKAKGHTCKFWIGLNGIKRSGY